MDGAGPEERLVFSATCVCVHRVGPVQLWGLPSCPEDSQPPTPPPGDPHPPQPLPQHWPLQDSAPPSTPVFPASSWLLLVVLTSVPLPFFPSQSPTFIPGCIF